MMVRVGVAVRGGNWLLAVKGLHDAQASSAFGARVCVGGGRVRRVAGEHCRGGTPKNGGGAPETVETAVPGEDAIATRLRAFLATAREGGDRFSGQVLVARNGEVLLHEAAGLSDAADGVFMTRENMMDCASIGKQFTAAAVLRLCEQAPWNWIQRSARSTRERRRTRRM